MAGGMLIASLVLTAVALVQFAAAIFLPVWTEYHEYGTDHQYGVFYVCREWSFCEFHCQRDNTRPEEKALLWSQAIVFLLLLVAMILQSYSVCCASTTTRLRATLAGILNLLSGGLILGAIIGTVLYLLNLYGDLKTVSHGVPLAASSFLLTLISGILSCIHACMGCNNNQSSYSTRPNLSLDYAGDASNQKYKVFHEIDSAGAPIAIHPPTSKYI